MNQEIEHNSHSGLKLVRYFIESIVEFKKVVWPKRSEAIHMTLFVIMFVAVFGVFIYGVDSLISLLFNFILVK